MPIDPVKTLLCAASALLAAPLARAADYGEVKLLATVPTPPGAPEGLAIDQNIAYVAGPARLGTLANGQPSRVLGFDATTGQLLHDWPTQGEDLLREHANSCVALDAAGRLHVLNSQLGLYRLDPATGVQTPYGAPFPDLPSCGLLVKAPCSPTLVDLPALPNDLVFTASGDAYVTDSFQATIWRVPAGGGAPQIWFQDQRFASAYIGVNGIRLDPARTRLYVSVSLDLLTRGRIYSLPLIAKPGPADLTLFHAFAAGDSPDGLAFGATGKLHVAVVLPTASGVVVLHPGGGEERRITNNVLTPGAPFDAPANLAFAGTGHALVINHAAISNLPAHFTLVDVFLDDPGDPLERPNLP